MKKVLFVATVVKMHIMVFHIPYLEWFKKNGYEVHVCARNDYDNELECAIPYCDKYFDVSFERTPFKLNNLRIFKQIKQIVNENEYEIIHCHTPMGGFLTRLASRNIRKKGTKVIYTAHGFHFFKGAPLMNWIIYYPIERWMARYTDILITINEEDYNAAQKFKSSKVIYIPGVGVDVTEFTDLNAARGKKREELGIKDDIVTILSVGELSKRKNHEVIIKALAMLNNPRVLYLICGQGYLDSYLKKQVEELKLNVRFLGFRRDISEICIASDIFAFPSYQEGLPVALMEAMASGLPAICSDVRGNNDLIKVDRGGILVKPNDAVGFTEGIRTLIDQTELRKMMGARNILEVQKYGKESVLEKMGIIYKSVLKNKDSERPNT
ncbi:glycosyltransferase family 4 protein [Paenibacillus sp. BAC0078]